MRNKKSCSLVIILLVMTILLTGCNNINLNMESKIEAEIEFVENRILLFLKNGEYDEYIKDGSLNWENIENDINQLVNSFPVIEADLSNVQYSENKINEIKSNLENIKSNLDERNFLNLKNEYGNLYIAKDSSTWQYTNPKDLNDKMNKLNNNANFEFKRLVRIIKYWNVSKNYRRYKSYFLEKYLTEKFETSYVHCNNMFDYLDWAFYHLGNYDANDEYISGRISNAQSKIAEAQNYEKNYNFDSAVESIKKIIPET